jgi:hypothetical protein
MSFIMLWMLLDFGGIIDDFNKWQSAYLIMVSLFYLCEGSLIGKWLKVKYRSGGNYGSLMAL